MSLYTRDYMKDDGRPGIGGPSTWSVVTRLIVLNVVVYGLNNLIFADPNRDWFALSLEALREGRVWTPLTFQFIHATPWHLLANLVGLFFLGRMLLHWLPPRQLVWIYLLGGLCGGILQVAWNGLFGEDPPVVGASGSVLAIAFATFTLAPHQRIQLLLFFLLPVNLTLRQLGWILLGLNALTLVLPQGGGEGERVAVLAHFGGILWGWAHIRLGLHTRSRKSSSREKRKKPAVATAPEKARPKPFVSADVDAILDKINAEGFQSLTAEDKRVLEQGSRQRSNPGDRKD